ncbi:dGTPase [Thiotrichales bacterium 19S3-7]|nr:dGTPase [Thiotrichales bacterium 19S3-7]MCF6801407.1 dGTPase [Thiotrichales bacterium 19S3-11]
MSNNGCWHTHRLKGIAEKLDDHRSAYERDCCRVIHSFPFRRLQGKLQIVSGNESDFHRNRLTHSIEVASIAQNILRSLRGRVNSIADTEACEFIKSQSHDIESLLFTIGLLHDIGHPPFGHSGEVALNYKMRNFGGFEGNAQTLRLITKISPLNLTKRTLLGVLKYPVKYSKFPKTENRAIEDKNNLIKQDDWLPPKCYYDEEEDIVNKVTSEFESGYDRDEFQQLNKNDKAQYKTFDCSIMDIADEISYSIHDLEDALFFKLINKEDIDTSNEIKSFMGESLVDDLFSNDHQKPKEAISQLVHKVMLEIQIKIMTNFSEPLLKYNVEFRDKTTSDFIKKLKDLVKDRMINSQHVKSIRQGGMRAIMQVFDVFVVRPKLMPKEEYQKYEIAQDEAQKMRVIADYISGMTDQFLFKMHRRLFGVNEQNTFDVIG